MGSKTKIDWCDATFNPVTGCLHGCEYCYARKIAERFGGKSQPIFVDYPVLHEPMRCSDTYGYMRDAGIHAGKIAPYPFDFLPTFHKYRLDEPQKWKKPKTIFVCSMADLFGDWVPDEWILEVFEACEAAPQHRYLFLTKNPKRYIKLVSSGVINERENYWFGSTATDSEMQFLYGSNSFVSIEPILEKIECEDLDGMDFDDVQEIARTFPKWVIIGAETGNRKNKVVPRREWIDGIVEFCKKLGVPVFMKESLRSLMGDDFKQEFPWEV